MPLSNNQRIAKNTIYLYIRTFIIMLVSLFTSRIVLQALGETDLGIYNLVGGIVALMAFLQTAQTKATSRFITYDLGLGGNDDRLSKTFSLCMTIHIVIALVIMFVAESLGLWLINRYAQIPENRLFAANVVFQLSLFTFVIHFIRCPLDSIIIAQEDMAVYAYMSILEVVLQLALSFLVLNFNGDKLILYGALVFLVSIVLFITYLIYKNKKYPVYKFYLVWDNKESLKILTFSGWTLLGSSANTLSQQGVSLLFNNFIGLVANTALGFANQVNAAVSRFVTSFTTAFNPQIIKYHALDNCNSLHILINRASRFSFALCYVMALPIIINMDFLLHFWLGNVPEYTKEFCQLILVCSIIDATTSVLNTSITATGKIKTYQILIALSFILDFTCAFILLKIRLHPALVFSSRILTRGFINMLIGLCSAQKLISFPIKLYVKEVVVPILKTLIITMPIALISVSDGWIKCIVSIILCIISVSVSTLFIIMKREERAALTYALKNRLYGKK